MKRISKVLAMLLAIAICLTTPLPNLTVNAVAVTTASGTCGTNVTWTLDSNGTLTISGSGKMGDYDIWFEDMCGPWEADKVKNVIIESGATNISPHAFSGCRYMTSIQIPDTVTQIGANAFASCYELTEIVIPSSVSDINGYWLFANCNKLTKITVDSNNAFYKDIDGVLFTKDGKELVCYPMGKAGVSYEIPEGVERIGDTAFMHSKLETVAIPNDVTTINQQAFAYCNKLKNIIIPEGVATIGDRAFDRCESLTDIIIPNTVTTINNEAFSACFNLTSITIPASVTSIGTGVFESCTSLVGIYVDANNAFYADADGILYDKNFTSLITYPAGRKSTDFAIPDGVTDIKEGSLSGLGGITVVNIPKSVKNIETYSLSGVGSLRAIVVDEANEYYTSVDGVLFNKDCTEIIYYPYCKSGESYTIPSGVERVAEGAFANSALASITIPNSVTSIGKFAFNYCRNLKKIEIPESVKSLGDGYSGCVFQGCSSLEEIIINNGVENIGDATFNHCTSLKKITIPDSVKTMGEYIFRGCTSLEEIKLSENIEHIYAGTFSECRGLKNITIPKNVKSISYSAFSYCPSLLNIFVDRDNSDYADFNGILFNKTYTELIYYPRGRVDRILSLIDGCLSIIESSFSGNTSLEEIEITDDVTNIGDEAFAGCTNLESVTVRHDRKSKDEGGVAPIALFAFDADPTLIGTNAFANCVNLKLAEIPEGITSIDSTAFTGCTSLETVKIYGMSTYIPDETIPSNVTIYGCNGSTAEEYATANGNRFVSLDVTTGDFTDDGKVTLDDAIYLLYHTFNPTGYPLGQSGDFTGDGNVTLEDAIYLLYHTFNPTGYPLDK